MGVHFEQLSVTLQPISVPAEAALKHDAVIANCEAKPVIVLKLDILAPLLVAIPCSE